LFTPLRAIRGLKAAHTQLFVFMPPTPGHACERVTKSRAVE
jgi:hypothetical protein